VSFAGQTRTAVAGGDGKWMVRLTPLRASAAGRSLRIGQVEITDVLVARFGSARPIQHGVDTAAGPAASEEEIAKAHWPKIRLNLIEQAVSGRPLTELHGSWTETTPETMREILRGGILFAREVHQKLQVPVGLVGLTTAVRTGSRGPGARFSRPTRT